jgi:hypothetical protein
MNSKGYIMEQSHNEDINKSLILINKGMRRTVIIKRIKDYLEETNSTQKPHLEKYTYQELKKVLYLYNLTEDENIAKHSNKNTDI